MYNHILKRDLEDIILQKDINIIKGSISGNSINIESEYSLSSYTYYDRNEQRDSDMDELLILLNI